MNHESDVAEAPRRRFNVAPPENILQQQLVRIWQGVLDKRPVGIDDDFFQMGGTHDTCERLFAACEDLIDEPVRPGDVSGKLSVRNLASVLVARLEARASGRAPAAPPRPSRLSEPQDILQDRLADLWERLLERSRVGIDDDFFGLGGTPESAERMFAAVEELYGERLGESDMPNGRITVRNMGEALVARARPARVMQIQAGAPDVAPLFFCHGDIGGGGYYVRDLARALGQEWPVFVLSLHGMHGEDLPPFIEAIAADHIAALNSVWADGPVYLGGHCISAIIALEMARQLMAQGRQVACAVLIEPPFVCHADGLAWLPPPRLSPAARRLPRVRVAWLLTQYLSILRHYQFGSYSGKVAVFWAEDGRQRLDRPERRELAQAVAPNVEFHTCPGTHNTALGRNMNLMAAAIRACLQAQTA